MPTRAKSQKVSVSFSNSAFWMIITLLAAPRMERLNGIAMELAKGGLKVTPRFAVGNPVDIIRSMAEEEDVSLIAMSSVGKDTLRTDRIGSRTYDLANSAKRPILVVRLKPVFEAKSA
jgi:nucleotide-binding universal stress UspA family protein